MVPWLFFVLVTAVFAKNPSKKSTDSESSGTDFFPQYNGFPSRFLEGSQWTQELMKSIRPISVEMLVRSMTESVPKWNAVLKFCERVLRAKEEAERMRQRQFPVHSSAVLPPQDLTALQQTHVLGDFQNRFQQQRFLPPQFQNQPLLFNQQTEFGEPQPPQNQFIDQRQPPQHVLTPPQEQRPQTPFNSQDQRPQPPFNQQEQRPQSSFNQPPRYRPFSPALPKSPQFPQQNQQFQENRPPFLDQRNPQFSDEPRQQQSSFQDQSHRTASNFPSTQNNPLPDQSFPPQQQFRQPPLRLAPQQQFTNSFPNQAFPDSPSGINQPYLNDRQRNQPKNPTFSDSPSPAENPYVEQTSSNIIPNSPSFGDQRNPSFISETSGNQPFQQSNAQFVSTQQRNPQNNLRFPQENFFNNVPPPPPPPLPQQPNSQPPSGFFPIGSQGNSHRFGNQFQSSSNNIPPFNQQQFEQQRLPENGPITPPFQHQGFPLDTQNENPGPISLNPNKKHNFPTLQYQKPGNENTAQYNLNVVHPHAPVQPPKESKPNHSERRPLLPLLPTEIPSIAEPTTTQINPFTIQKSQQQNYYQQNVPIINEISQAPTGGDLPAFKSNKIKKPKPEVKEITINLAPTPVPAPETPTKKDKTTRKEKSQEDLINEQIHKLLESHNLELLNRGPKNGEGVPAIPDLPDNLKGKVKIQLVNSDILSDIKGGVGVKNERITPTFAPTIPPLPDLPDHIKKQYDIKLVQKDELFKQFKIGSGGKLLANADLVSPLPGNPNAGNGTTVFLANGQQLQIVNLPKSEGVTKVTATTTTTAKPPKELFEELAKGVIPPGADFELIKHNADGQVEKVKDLTTAKKVTFVILEEQPDGTVKVQGVKGNGNPEKTERESVDSLIKKIKDGSLKLPPSNPVLTNEIPRKSTVYHEISSTAFPFTSAETDLYTTESYPTTASGSVSPYASEGITFFTTPASYDELASTIPPTVSPYLPTSKKPKSKSRPSFLPTPNYNNAGSSSKRYKGSKRPMRRKPTTTTTSTTTAQYEYDDEDYNQRSSNYNGEGPIPQDVVGQESNLEPSRSLTAILQDHSLREMAKFLDQSGLDTILNETGPYTMFIPTDAAFANLQVQLGGTDKAEDKFRENPRLLSGLLLHHVVPGSFRVSDLQDEMTGVSLAGTQLRVNTYHSERKTPLVTINGAVVSEEKRDIAVPQGIAHAVDRVLFPLPVGDLFQTLKGDRERRFTKFVKAVEASGLADLLTGTKTYTIFAPTDRAFAALTDEELDKLLAKREAARTIVLRHVTPGTLYSAGMHFFQVKESMEKGQKITLQKELGKIKANTALISAPNVPATNGVIHILDSLL